MDFMKTSDNLSLFICHVRKTINSLKYLTRKVCAIAPYTPFSISIQVNWDKLNMLKIFPIWARNYARYQPSIFCNRFEELQTMLFEVELIINNAPLIYV